MNALRPVVRRFGHRKRPKRIPVGARLRALGARVTSLPVGTSVDVVAGSHAVIVIEGMVLASEANRSRNEHWSKTRARVNSKRDRAGVAAWYAVERLSQEFPLAVIITRVAPRALDSDNVHMSAKSVRDGIADALGVDDRDPRVTWTCDQERGAPAVKIRIETIREGARSLVPIMSGDGVACE